MISVIGIGGLVCISGNNSTVAVVVYVCKKVVQNASHLNRCEGRGVTALLGDAIASAEIITGAASEHAGALLTSRALHALVVGAIVSANATVFDVTISPDAAVVDARCDTSSVARIANASIVGA